MEEEVFWDVMEEFATSAGKDIKDMQQIQFSKMKNDLSLELLDFLGASNVDMPELFAFEAGL